MTPSVDVALIGCSRYEPRPEIKTILMTGAAGFIGSWVARHFVRQYANNYRIVCFDKLDYCATLNNVAAILNEPNFVFERGDVGDADRLLDVLRKYAVDAVVHFAAQSHVDLSFGNSYSFTRANVLGTHILLECAQNVAIKRFIHVSTDEVYGEVAAGDADLLETAILAPTNPYAATKAAAEMLVHAYHKSFRLPVVIVRSNNVYGPHQFPEKIIPKFCMLLSRNLPCVLHGDGSPTRRYLYAGDAADAFDTIFHLGKVGEIYNIGSKDEVSNRDLCVRLLQSFDISTEDQAHWVRHTHDRPFNDMRYAVDAAKLHKLGWKQSTTLENGLAKTVAWYRAHGETWWGDISPYLRAFPEVASRADQV
ncbi:hypothetical protein PYCC9005_001059 [Savitreella phatthalungensis]